MIFTAVSCSVYDASLIGNGSTEPGNGGMSSAAGQLATAGDGNDDAGRGGSAGKPAVNGGSNSSAGDGGMDAAGAPETGGEGADGGTPGASGSAGNGGGASGGRAGGGSGGGTTGGDGSAGSKATGGGGATASGGTGGGGAGSAGSPPANGCAKLSVPLDDAGDRAHFVISLPSATDLSAPTATVSMRLYVQAGVGGTIFNYVQDSQYRFFGVATAQRPTLASLSGWSTITFNVGNSDTGTTGIVRTDIRRIGIEINAAPSSSWSNPTVVYVDSITVATPALSYTLDNGPSVNPTPLTADPSGQALWLNSGSMDTKATNVTLGWQSTCP